MDQAQAANPRVTVEVWAFDEHRLGLKPITRQVWARKGQRPIARVNHRYQWLYLYGFVEPGSGEVVWYLCNTVNIEAFQKTLEAFARETGAGPDKIIILVLDNAGWHVPAGTSRRRSNRPRVSSSSSCRPTPPNSSPPSGCGRWPTRPSSTQASRPSKTSPSTSPNDAANSATTQDPVRRLTLFHRWPRHA